VKKISIITPIFNGAKTLEITLSSIYAQHAIQNNICKLEHIIRDGVSGDDAALISAQFSKTSFLISSLEPSKKLINLKVRSPTNASA
jgi:glycosyltransferase involved in cell wall biosynthesis